LREFDMFSPLYEKALRFALDRHADQKRKGGAIPYVTHVIHVAHILACHGYGEEVVAAGLLHDILEDTPVNREEMESAFGPDVTAIVLDVTEPPKTLPWRERKGRHVEGLRDARPASRAVKAADILHNLTSMRDDLEGGEPLWSRFHAGRDDQLWYYRGALEALGNGWEHPLLDQARQRLKEVASYRVRVSGTLFREKGS
jgi:(p)ppGpp synthase/HD superfamily hydrolase